LSDHATYGDSDDDPGPPSRAPLGDEAELYRAFNPHFVRIVQRRANTSPDIVDDACAFAWQQFMRYQPDRERNWRSWLITIAERGVAADRGGGQARLVRPAERRRGTSRLHASRSHPTTISRFAGVCVRRWRQWRRCPTVVDWSRRSP
jgi:hypothetical protein